MTTHTEDSLKYPIGRFHYESPASKEELDDAIRNIAILPAWIKEIVDPLNDKELAKSYRSDGWNVRQIIHHLADSHINAYIRFRLALTEEEPVIKPYKEELWALLPDAMASEVMPSLEILDGIHSRWAMLLEHMEPGQFERTFIHPEHNRRFTLAECACMYSWHGRHHLGHIQRALGK